MKNGIRPVKKGTVSVFILLLLVPAGAAVAQDRATVQSYLSQVQSLRSELAGEQRSQQELLKTKQLLMDGDRVNREQTAKLKLDSDRFESDIDVVQRKRAALTEEERTFDAELNALKAQRDANHQAIEHHTTRYGQHNSWQPNPYDHGAVNAYNAEADQLNSEAAQLNARKAQLDAARDNLVTRGNALDQREAALKRESDELGARAKALDQKEADLKWAREKMNEQTLKWAEDTKRNNARLNDLSAQLNALLTRISQLSGPCGSITGVGTLDLTNLNSASEQASRCLQQMWDGASAGSTAPVAPKPPFRVAPN